MSDTSTKQAARLLFLHAQTGLHPGSGTALGVVDLPVQRERHTHWPTIPGSALKGVLRDNCRETAKADHADEYHEVEKNGGKVRALKRSRRQVANEDNAKLVAVFGPGKGTDASDHAGALAVTDARLAAFPVRSLRGVFAWVTCPAVLVRLNRDLKLGGLPELTDVPAALADTDLLCAAESPLRVGGTKVVLEEFEYTATGTCDAVADWFATHATADALTRNRLKAHLAVIGDNAFTHYARYASEIVARVGLNYDTKTVKDGALFYQEVLPAETLLYAVALAHPSRKEGTPLTADEVLNYLGEQLQKHPVIQIGGDETVGKGLCFAHLTGGKGN
jgi:CRISPR-associated protein Cmr4